MPSSAIKKTALVLSDLISLFDLSWNKLRWLLLFLVLLAAALVAVAYFSNAQGDRLQIPGSNKSYQLTVSKTSTEQQKGLGGQNSIPENSGMLFWFNNSAQRCFWMQDMHFPLDIIWLSDSKKIKYIETNVQPGTYPKAFCHSARYVVELNAGEAAQGSLKLGQQLIF